MISKITDQLYLSRVTDVLGTDYAESNANLQTLENLGITHILSVCPEPDLILKETALFAASNNGFTFHSEPVPTSHALPNEDPWIKGLNLAIKKVAAILQKVPTAKVLVHCIEGIDRSPFIVASIIAQQNQVELNRAYQIVKAGRSIIKEHYEWLNA